MVLNPKLGRSEELQTHATPILKDLFWNVWVSHAYQVNFSLLADSKACLNL